MFSRRTKTLFFKTFRQATLDIKDCDVIEGSPRLYVTPVGNLPSVTSVLSAIKVYDDGIDKWRKRVGDEEADRITNAASYRGNKLHDYAERYLLNRLKRSEMTGTARLMFNRCQHYYDQIEAVYATECVLYSKSIGYAGRADAVVYMNKNSVLDHKNSRRQINSSQQYARRKLFIYMLQCAGYSIAFQEMFNEPLEQGIIIMANYNESNAKRYIFDIDDYLVSQFKLAVDIYNGKEDARQSDYYKL